MEPPVSPIMFSVALFVGMLLLLETGRRLGMRHRPKESGEERSNLGTIEGAIFALFRLLIAFTFGGAAVRFNEKRMLVAEEANAIGTAYLRLNLVANGAQPRLKECFRRYMDSRLEIYRKMPDTAAVAIEMGRSKEFQETIWRDAVAATTLPGSHPDAGKLLLPALNNMNRMASSRYRLHIFSFTIITVVVVYVILDVEYPRASLIRLASQIKCWLSSAKA